MPLPLETARLLLREMTAADWRAIHAYNRDPAFHRFLPIDPPSARSTQGFVQLCLLRARERPRRHYDPVIVETASGEVVGTLRLGLREPGVADIGYAIRPDRWSRGFATEAAGALLAALRLRLALRQVWATVDPDNAASLRVMQKLGFRPSRGRTGAPIKHGRPPSFLFVADFVEPRAAERAA
jgi:ribosomal-protein-alanine N-acetyltransferase